MEFGGVPENELSGIDFKLPPEPPGNIKVLGGVKVERPGIYVGCARWGTAKWSGKIYPPGTKEKDYITQYVQHFNCIELNATHYKIYDTATIEKWSAKATRQDFLFLPKMFNGITHQGILTGKGSLVTEFLDSVAVFGERLGPIFIQLSESFSPGRKEELFAFLKTLPAGYPFYLEVRHPEWFSNDPIRRELFNTLYTLNIGTVITDTAGRRDCSHMHLTVPKVFIRYVGNNLHPTDYPRIDDWVNRLAYWFNNGLQDVYFIMHMHEELCAPEMILYMSDKLYAATGLHIQKPAFIHPGTLPEGSQIPLL